MNDKLYRVTTPISTSDTIIPNTNVTLINNIGDQIQSIKSTISALNQNKAERWGPGTHTLNSHVKCAGYLTSGGERLHFFYPVPCYSGMTGSDLSITYLTARNHAGYIFNAISSLSGLTPSINVQPNGIHIYLTAATSLGDNNTPAEVEVDGTITFSDAFKQVIAALQAAAGQAIENLQITEPPVDPYDVPNKQYVDDMIAQAGHLKREIVQQLPDPAEADENTLYMILAPSGDYYEEYMVINGAWDMVGETGDGGSGGGFQLEIATHERLGGVKSSTDPNYIAVEPNTGFMTLTQVSTSLLYVPTGDTLTIYGGSA